VISLGSSQKLRAGDVVLAIGDPFGLDKTVTQGIVSATGRTARTEVGILENLIQTDAAINPGNSGGALIDTFGRLIGINTAIYSRTGGNQGISFAIPIDEATQIMNQLIEGKPIVRGYLGIMMQPLDKEIRDYIQYKEENGVYIRAVVKDSPSQKAGLLPGDVLIKINNIPVKDDREGSRLVAGLTPGKSYPVEIFRKGDYITYTVILGERKQGLNAKPMPEQQP
jgi:S1-C subfamily serine protease